MTDADRDDAIDSTAGDGEHHATTGGSAAAGAVTGGLIGMAAGPAGAAVGAVGGALVGAIAERVMHSDDDAERADMGLPDDRDANPMIEDRGETGMTDRTGRMDVGRMDTGTGAASTMATGSTVRLHEEELTARKTPVQTGEVEIRKEVVTENRTIEVPVTREEVVVERHPTDRQPATDASFQSGEQTIRVPVMEEQVTVEKRPVVTEEISVGKRVVQDTETVSGTVRREEARIEREGDTRMTGTTGTTGSTPMGSAAHSHEYVSGRCSCGEAERV